MSTNQADLGLSLIAGLISGDKLVVGSGVDQELLESHLRKLPRVKLTWIASEREVHTDCDIRFHGKRGTHLIFFLRVLEESKPLMRYNPAGNEHPDKVRQIHIPETAVAIEFVNFAIN